MLLGIGFLGIAVTAGYQIGACELANIELQDDMQDMAAQLGTRVGYSPYKNDNDLRNAVIGKAERYGIELEPNQVTVEHMGSEYTSTVYLAADYKTLIHVPGYSFVMHFTPATGKRLLLWRPHG